MATTGSNFVLVQSGGNAILSGSTAVATPFVAVLNPPQCLEAVNATPTNTAITAENAVCLDRVTFDLSMTTVPPPVGSQLLPLGTFVGGFAKNGCIYITFTGTTAVTLDVTNAANSIGVTCSQAGDALASLLNSLVIKNVSASASTITVAPGGSNPVVFPNVLAGTTPTFALAKGDVNAQYSAVGGTVSASQKTILFTPTAGGAIAVSWGGA